MSSFTNSPKHFSTIKKGLIKLITTKNNRFSLPCKAQEFFPKIYDQSYFVKVREKAIINQINNFASLQVLCVHLQYKDNTTSLDTDIMLNTKEVVRDVECDTVNNYELLKLIECVIYQIETNNLEELRALTTEEDNALEFMEICKESLMKHIIEITQDYMDAKYCI